MTETLAAPIIREFQGDERRWWIKWVDGYSSLHLGTATPTIGVLLCPLDNTGTWSLRDRPDDSRIVRVFTGQIPGLQLGNIYRKGEFVGRIPDNRRTFVFDFESDLPEVHFVDQPQNDAPEWRKFPYRLINRSEYRLGSEFFKSSCFRMLGMDTDSGERIIVVIPVQEVIRTYLTPDTPFALALTSAPWNQTINSLVDIDKTFVEAPGVWQVVTRKKVRDIHYRNAALISLDERWSACAKRVHANMLRSPGVALASIGMPFEQGKLTLSMRCIDLRPEPHTVLCLCIRSTTWPTDDVHIKWRSENWGDKGTQQEKADKPKPYAHPDRPIALDKDGRFLNVSTEDPETGSGPVLFPSDGAFWINPPTEERIKKDVSYVYEARPPTSAASAIHEGSAGNPSPSIGETGKTSFPTTPSRDPTQRFIEVVRVLDILRSTERISLWLPILPDRNPLYRGDLPTWAVPLPKKYATRRPPARVWNNLCSGVHRAALVCLIRFSEKTCILIEIECRPSEAGYRTALFQYRQQPLNLRLSQVLTECSSRRGIWPPDIQLASLAGAVSATTWKHRYKGKSTTSLDGESLVRALTRLVS